VPSLACATSHVRCLSRRLSRALPFALPIAHAVCRAAVVRAVCCVVFVMGFETRVGTWVWVGRVWVWVEFEAPVQNPYPRCGFQRVWPWPGPLLIHQQNMKFSNNRLQNIEQKHISTILNIAGFFQSGPIPSIFDFLLPLCCSGCRSCYIITLLALFFSHRHSLPLRLPPQHGLNDKVSHSILFFTNQFLCTGPPPF